MLKKLIAAAVLGTAVFGYFFFLPKKYLAENGESIVSAAEATAEYAFLIRYEVELREPRLVKLLKADRMLYSVPVYVKDADALCPEFLIYVMISPEWDGLHFGWTIQSVSVHEEVRT